LRHFPTPKERSFCANGTFGPAQSARKRPGSLRSEDTIFATYNNAGVRVFDIRDAFAPKEIAYWVPPTPKKLIDPRPNVALAAKAADVYVTTDGLMYVSDWNAGSMSCSMKVSQSRFQIADSSKGAFCRSATPIQDFGFST
jgi:hypothetical protein